MTRRDFQLIARTIKAAREPEDRQAARRLTEALATALATTNPRFDRGRFLHESGQ